MENHESHIPQPRRKIDSIVEETHDFGKTQSADEPARSSKGTTFESHVQPFKSHLPRFRVSARAVFHQVDQVGWMKQGSRD